MFLLHLVCCTLCVIHIKVNDFYNNNCDSVRTLRAFMFLLQTQRYTPYLLWAREMRPQIREKYPEMGKTRVYKKLNGGLNSQQKTGANHIYKKEYMYFVHFVCFEPRHTKFTNVVGHHPALYIGYVWSCVLWHDS